jgi:hypothetical protein
MITEIEHIERRDRRAEIKCSECGVIIGGGDNRTPMRLCLICYARKLNDYFQRLRAYASP